MNEPGISICIPVYNGEKYLRQCLDSVIAQEYQNTEIIIVDDCSTDGTNEIIKEYENKFPKIKYYKNEINLGLVGNWNRCIDLAKKEWITLIFQDDYFEKNAILRYVDFINRNELVSPLIVSQRNFMTETLSEKQKEYYEKELPRLDELRSSDKNKFIDATQIGNAAVKNMSMNFIGEPVVLMFRKGEERFNPELEQICDLEFALRLGAKYGLHYLSERLTWFRIHEDSITSRNAAEKFFRMSNLEPVKFAHLLLLDADYQLLRKNLSLYNRIRLYLYFYVRGHEAWDKAKMNQQFIADFNSTAMKFPGMNKLKKSGLITGILYSILKIKRSFSNK